MKKSFLVIFFLFICFFSWSQTYKLEKKMEEAIRDCSIAEIDKLINNGLDVNYTEKYQTCTWLYRAVVRYCDRNDKKERKDVIYHLLKKGADPQIACKDGDKPAWVAYRYGDYFLANEIENRGRPDTSQAIKPELIINKGDVSEIKSISISSDSKLLVICTGDYIILMDFENGEILHRINQSAGGISFFPFSDQLLVVHFKEIQIWDLDNSEPLQKQTLTGHTGYIYAIDISTDGKYIVSGASDKTIKYGMLIAEWKSEILKDIKVLSNKLVL